MRRMGVVGVNAIIGYATESQSEGLFIPLGVVKRTTLVIRNGCRTEISTEDVVPGDILVLKSGNYVAADARLLETDHLSIDESALTGESVTKTAKTHW